MAYIGNTQQNQNYVPAVDYFNGDGSTVAFTLSRPVASVAQVQAVIENVPQNPGSAYTVSGNTITFTSAPPSGASNIYIYYTSPNTQVIQPGQGTVGATQIVNGAVNNQKLDVASTDGTGAAQMPVGTTAERPAGANGYYRFNSTTGYPEWYSSATSTWQSYYQQTPYSVDYLVVAGGGAGADTDGGGGGAGGYIASTGSITPGGSFSVTVGAGAPRQTINWTRGSNGNNSSFIGGGISDTAIGGGGGGTGSLPVTTNDGYGNSGGSGGGAGSTWTSGHNGAGTSGQGNAGGNGVNTAGGGGGGGANAAGTSAGPSGTAGPGGAGKQWLNGSYYAGGGGGGHGTGGSGGIGGGGNGSAASGVAGADGTANTGGGGGGGGAANSDGGAGGSGIVIIRYAGSQRGTGGTVTSSGGYTYHTFTTSGTYTA